MPEICLSCAHIISDYWEGPVRVIECVDEHGRKVQKRRFRPFDNMTCPRFLPQKGDRKNDL